MHKLLPFEDVVIKRKSKDDLGRVKYESTCALCGELVTYVHGEKLELCPFCGQNDYIKPLTETRLFRLQAKWNIDRNPEVLGSMYMIMVDYSESLLKNLLPPSFTHHYEKVSEKASDASNLIIEYYLSKPNFQIEKSFGGYINKKIREVLWNKKDQEEDNNDSLNSSLNIGAYEEKEMLDSTTVLGMTSLFGDYENYVQQERDKTYMLNGLEFIIKSMANNIRNDYGIYYQMTTLMGISYFIANQGNMKKFYDLYKDAKIKSFIDKAMLIIYEFIKGH